MGPGDLAPGICRAVAAALDASPAVLADALDRLATERPPLVGAAHDWAASGAMALTGRADGPPMVAPGAIATGVRAHLALLAASSVARGASPVGLPGPGVMSERAALTGWSRRAPLSVGGAFRAHRAVDGWIGLSLARADDLALVPALIARDVRPPADPDDARALIDEWARETPTEEAAERLRLLGLPGGRIPHPDDAPDEQTRFRRGRLAARSPGAPTLPASAPPTGVILGPPGAPVRSARAPHVVDFSALWAGPLCAHLLGLTGATVTKVEFAGREDGARAGEPAFYDLLHHGHRSVRVDVRSAAGREELARLVESADVVIEASRPRALAAAGLDAATAVARGAVWVSITAYGRSGPWADGIGFGDDVACGAGAVVHPDGPDGAPAPCGDALADPVTGVLAAAAASVQLARGRGALVDVSMHGAVRDLVTASPSAPHEVVRDDGRWVLVDGLGRSPVAEPTARVPGGSAPGPGAHRVDSPPGPLSPAGVRPS